MLVAAKVKTDMEKSCGKNACKSYWLMHRAAHKGCPIRLFIFKFSKEECRIGGIGQRILPSGQEVDMSVKVATGSKRQAILSNLLAILRDTYILIHTGHRRMI